MTVEMGEVEGMGGGAFVWPEEVKDFEKYVYIIVDRVDTRFSGTMLTRAFLQMG
jgi:hypothetical protein